MKNLIISLLIVIILTGGWLFFDNYSHEVTNALSSMLENEIIPLAENEEWKEAAQIYDQFETQWEKYKKVSLVFLESDQISEIDLCVARAQKYIEAEDVSNSAGELCSIVKQLELLDKREKITFSNVL